MRKVPGARTNPLKSHSGVEGGSVGECLPNTYKALGLIPSTEKKKIKLEEGREDGKKTM